MHCRFLYPNSLENYIFIKVEFSSVYNILKYKRHPYFLLLLGISCIKFIINNFPIKTVGYIEQILIVESI